MRSSASLCTLLAPVIAAVAPVLSASLTLYLPATSNPFGLPPRTHATLDSLTGGHRAAPLSAVNTFVFHNLTPGSYLADVHCPLEAFHPLRIDVGPADAVAAWETFRGNDWHNRGEALPLKHDGAGLGFQLRSLGTNIYFLERPRFSILGILKNPMILMGLVSMLIFIGMPYLVDNMNPEMKAEFEAQQRQGGPMATIMGGGQQGGNALADFDMAAFLAGSKKKDTPASTAVSGSGQNQGVRR